MVRDQPKSVTLATCSEIVHRCTLEAPCPSASAMLLLQRLCTSSRHFPCCLGHQKPRLRAVMQMLKPRLIFCPCFQLDLGCSVRYLAVCSPEQQGLPGRITCHLSFQGEAQGRGGGVSWMHVRVANIQPQHGGFFGDCNTSRFALALTSSFRMNKVCVFALAGPNHAYASCEQACKSCGLSYLQAEEAQTASKASCGKAHQAYQL